MLTQPDRNDIVFLDDGRQAELPGFDPYFARWIEQLRERHKSPSTVCTYAQALPPCLATLQSIAGTDVTVRAISLLKPALFEQMQQRMYEEGAKDRTIKLRMAALRSFGRFLLQREYARCYGLLMSRLLDFERQPLHTPGEADCDNLVEIASTQPDAINWEAVRSWETVRDRAVLRSISAHRLTIAEALAVDREHLCLAERTLIVVGRSRRRVLLLETEVIQDILAYLEVCPYEIENGSPLFRGTRGARLVPRVVQLATKTLRNQLGLHEEVTPRAIRKSRVLQLLASGARDYDIMQQVGISASAMGSILREVPLNPLEVEEAIRKANSILLSLRSMATDGDQAQDRSFKKSDPKQRSG
jgi:integrase/recombinase XerC